MKNVFAKLLKKSKPETTELSVLPSALIGAPTIVKGRRGEDVAVAYLKRKGYKILERNFKYGGCEVDIVAMDGDTVVLIEVKSRSDLRFGMPSEAVDANKRRRYVFAANGYRQTRRCYSSNLRFDIIEVLDGKVNHIIDAFTA